ncbi:aspartate ammonia-lyase [Gorillibacterium sp. sgz5001074]|uniref:aspartate ammonia-lyase n=1 Tax=Gorillibacterium sp. sgz5001074 TaxID=3446695 RepID=UPI003F669E84
MSDAAAPFRTETDMLGTKSIPADALYGIHTARAMENFSISGKPANPHLIQAIITVKQAAALANGRLKLIPAPVAEAIAGACEEAIGNPHRSQFPVDAFQGGAGTSTHMNVNEVIANLAILRLGGRPGDYGMVHPVDHVNCGQSTNDVYPTALKIAAIRLLRPLSRAFASLQEALQEKEQELADVLKLGRTQLMDALPMTAGQGFGAYAKAIARDRWRIYKVEERLREINLGGTAIGTGLNAPLKYIYTVTELLQDLTGLGLARSEYPMDLTQNMDVFVEVSGMLKAAASNLLKISNDLRLLASGPRGGLGELRLPAVQAGSSIMPGKANPVIAEMMGQTAMRVIANDSAITMAAMSGQLELNAFTPLIAECLLESLELLTRAVTLFEEKCIRGIEADRERCLESVELSSALAAALVNHVGYAEASRIALAAQAGGCTVRDVLLSEGRFTPEETDRILNLHQVTKPGTPGK